MSQTIAQRADELLADAEAGAKAYAERVAKGDRNTELNYRVGILESLVRRLSDSVEMQAESIANQSTEIQRLTKAAAEHAMTITRQRNQIREQAEQLNDLRFQLCDDDGEDTTAGRGREAAAFARSTGAAGALRGEPL